MMRDNPACINQACAERSAPANVMYDYLVSQLWVDRLCIATSYGAIK